MERTRAHLLDIKEMLILYQNNKKEKEYTIHSLEEKYLRVFLFAEKGFTVFGPEITRASV